MTAYNRAFQPGGTYFFTVVTEQCRPLLIEHIDRLHRAFRIGLERRPVQINAVVVLPDHLHRRGGFRKEIRISRLAG